MNYTIEQFHADVAAEAKALRKHATKEELGRLDFENLDPTQITTCIYGQLTQHCFSRRASILIGLCCKRYVKTARINNIQEEGFEMIKDIVNGETVDNLYEDRQALFNECHYSSIEAYILLPDANNAALIAYLRGETDDLVL